LSTQEERFAQIAAAIREKDGSTGPIKALDFAARIRAIQAGGGGGVSGFEILEKWETDKNIFKGAIKLGHLSVSPHTVQIEILEGYP